MGRRQSSHLILISYDYYNFIQMSYEEVFKCIKCKHDYDQICQPMMICSNYHTICRLCLNDICKIENKYYGCPFCRASIIKRQAIYLGCFFQYRKIAQQLTLLKGLAEDENKDLNHKVRKYKQKIDSLKDSLYQSESQNSKMKIQMSKLKSDNENLKKRSGLRQPNQEGNYGHIDFQQIISLKSRLAISSASYEKQIKEIAQLKNQLIKAGKDRQMLKEANQALTLSNKQLKENINKKQMLNDKKEALNEKTKIQTAKNNSFNGYLQQIEHQKRLCLFHIKNENRLSNKVIRLKRRIMNLLQILEQQTGYYNNLEIQRGYRSSSQNQKMKLLIQKKQRQDFNQTREQLQFSPSQMQILKRELLILQKQKECFQQTKKQFCISLSQNQRLNRQLLTLKRQKNQSQTKLQQANKQNQRLNRQLLTLQRQKKQSQTKLQFSNKQNERLEQKLLALQKLKETQQQKYRQLNEYLHKNFQRPVGLKQELQEKQGIQQDVPPLSTLQRIIQYVKKLIKPGNKDNKIIAEFEQKIKNLQVTNQKLSEKITKLQESKKEIQIKSDKNIKELLSKQKIQHQKTKKKLIDQNSRLKKNEEQISAKASRQAQNFSIKQKYNQQQIQKSRKTVQKLQKQIVLLKEQNKTYFKQLSNLKKSGLDCLQINDLLIKSIDHVAQFNEAYIKKIVEIKNNLVKFQNRES